MKVKPKIKRRVKIRNWIAVSAHNRNSAGPIKDKKKERNKNRCRKSKQPKTEY